MIISFVAYRNYFIFTTDIGYISISIKHNSEQDNNN